MRKRNTSRLFITAISGIVLFEVTRTYLVMPLPGSQIKDTVDLAWFLHHHRLYFRILLYGLLLAGFLRSLHAKWFLTTSLLLATAAISTVVNFNMRADRIFRTMKRKVFASASTNQVPMNKIILGVVNRGVAKAYPMQFVGYHHRIFDTLNGEAIMVTYCTVCRTGRVYRPFIDGEQVDFKLVGMDHWNAMFEDKSTGSWWRQATGECIAGEHKGKFLPEVPFVQVSLREWLAMHPKSAVLQPDPKFAKEYESLKEFETGKRPGKLTHTDTASWHDKSWVIGLQEGKESLALDWNEVKIAPVQGMLGNRRFVAWVSPKQTGTYAYYLPDGIEVTGAKIVGDTLHFTEGLLSTAGQFTQRLENSDSHFLSPTWIPLEQLQVYQEFWHSWKYFHPNTKVLRVTQVK